ncbi:glycosyltransferase [Neolewinella aurantiaca]|uniref:Glycosyltransferase n=1 Tax=Neolewinella aurantiaca TaxID=2602767 RepID=A0A5C7FLP2_9BACT|nr:glycosyltransferase family 2 protein [Neolewinella aurantiaca]TXF90959.1 glycosyltransferase [Neolewinella aurantiaca]
MEITDNKPLISIITVVYNGAAYLEETIRSVLAQDYSNYEYIIIDGGSTDGSVEIIKRYADHLVYWVSEPDRGMYDAINKGIGRAKGEIWTSLNSDDRLASEGVFSAVIDAYRKHPEHIAYFGNIIKERDGERRHIRLEDVGFQRLLSSRHCTFMPQPATYNVKAKTDAVGYFDDQYRYAADYDYHLRILKEGTALHVPIEFTIFRQHEDALTSTGNDKMREEKEKIITAHGYGQQPLKERLLYFIGWSKYAIRNKLFTRTSTAEL